MAYHYSVFGLTLFCNLSIPRLSSIAAAHKEADVKIFLDQSPSLNAGSLPEHDDPIYVSQHTDEVGRPALRVWSLAESNVLLVVYSDGTRFWIDRAGTCIRAMWPVTSSLEDTATYLIGPVLGLLLRLRGVTCLHASAVALGDRAVAFVGSAGAGKSTTVAALARRGYRVISEDILPLIEKAGTFCASPGYPYVCLWPDSVDPRYGPAADLPRLSPGWDKRCLALDHARFETRTLPLGAIFLVGRRRSDSAPATEAAPSPSALLNLVANSYATNLLGITMRAREFQTLSRLVMQVPVRMLYPHQDPAHIDDLCQLIRDDFGQLYSRPVTSRVAT